jgi:hypothetical protein
MGETAMSNRYFAGAATLLAGVSSAAMVMVPAVASAQSEADGYYPGVPPSPVAYQAPPASQYQSLPPPQYQSPPPPQAAPAPQYQSPPPPQGQYASQATAAGGADYNNWLYQQTLRDYRARYAQWSAQTQGGRAGPPSESCGSQRSTNIAAGAIVGGVAGALLGFSLAGWAVRGAWALFGGSVGLAAGAALGSSATNADCQRGYARGPGREYYGSGPGYGRAPAYASPYRGYAPDPRYYRRPVYANPGYADPGYGPPPSPYYRY